MCERRGAQRTRAADLSACVRPGQRVTVVDVSAGGALVDAARPLRPGAQIEVQFERDTVLLRLRGTVLRCGIVALDPEGGPTYRAAISFAETFAWAREVATHDGYRVPDRRDLA